ncbi:MAG: membrane protein insertion efficiency factor YidD, partial [Anaerolineales bacterium]
MSYEFHINDSNNSNQRKKTHNAGLNLGDLEIKISNFPRLILLGLIRLYQATVSRALPANTCRFYPSCSHYGYKAIFLHGAFRGSMMAIWRVLRCNPF